MTPADYLGEPVLTFATITPRKHSTERLAVVVLWPTNTFIREGAAQCWAVRRPDHHAAAAGTSQ